MAGRLAPESQRPPSLRSARPRLVRGSGLVSAIPVTSTGLRDPLVRSRALDDDAFVACAAVVVSSRLECLSVIDAVEYLYYTADDIGVDTVEFARFITGSRQRRDWARGRPSRAQEDGHR